MEPSPVEEPATEQPSVVMPAQRREPDAPSGDAPSSVPTVETPPAMGSAQAVELAQAVDPARTVDPAQLVPLVPSTPPAAVTRRAQAGNRFPLWLAISFGALSLLCVAGLGIGFHYYDNATKPDRTTPAIAVQNYLQAFLDDRSDTEAAPYACADQSGLAAFKSFRDQALDLVASHGHTAAFGWEIGDVATAGNIATVDVTVTEQTFAGNVETGSAPFDWELTTRQTSGWRVCSAIRN